MTVLDAYAVLAYLRGEPAASAVATLLRTPTTLTAVNACEVLDQLVRVHRHDPDDVDGDLALLVHSGMTIAAVDPDLGTRAGRLRAQYYHRERMPVSLADCVAAATALARDEALATSDRPLAALVRAEGGAVHALADSTGQTP
ncbi:MAG: PIN domain-containing protein [Sporichthyaceae bacterium]